MSVDGCPSPEPVGGYATDCDARPLAVPFLDTEHCHCHLSFPAPQRVGDWVGLSGWLIISYQDGGTSVTGHPAWHQLWSTRSHLIDDVTKAPSTPATMSKQQRSTMSKQHSILLPKTATILITIIVIHKFLYRHEVVNFRGGGILKQH